jgi:hypothetical protein
MRPPYPPKSIRTLFPMRHRRAFFPPGKLATARSLVPGSQSSPADQRRTIGGARAARHHPTPANDE